MKFNIDDYKGKYAMHCKTKEEALDFCTKHAPGFLHGSSCCWNYYKEDTVYFFNKGTWDSLKYAKNNNYTILEWSDFMKFTKADLKTGDVVKFRNGEIGIVNGELRTIIMRDKFVVIHHFTEDLMYDGMNSKGEDIVAVRRPESVYHCQFCAFEKEYGILVYERKEVEEMTLAEVCRLLGKEIKIVK